MTAPGLPHPHPAVLDDSFTQRNREWFTQRYDFASQGIYFPHQPVYGFSRWDEHIQDYFRSYHLLRLLEEIEFDSLLDVGCAEGYFMNMVRTLFGARTFGVDIAPTGVERARQLYGLDGIAADAGRLPLPDKSYDVVLCSETLEHVANPKAVIDELLRVARHAVVLSTPAARSQADIDAHFAHLDPGYTCGHFHFFTEPQMRAWLPPGSQFMGIGHIRMRPLMDRFSTGYDQAAALRDLLKFLDSSCPTLAHDTRRDFARHVEGITATPPWWQALLGPRALGAAIRLEHWLAQRQPERTQAFLTLSPCDNAPLRRRRKPVPNLMRYLLRDNRVDPLRLAGVGAPQPAPTARAQALHAQPEAA